MRGCPAALEQALNAIQYILPRHAKKSSLSPARLWEFLCHTADHDWDHPCEAPWSVVVKYTRTGQWLARMAQSD